MNELNAGLIAPEAANRPLCHPASLRSSFTMKWISTSTKRALLARNADSARYRACTLRETPERSGGLLW
jgi:hypothetical protein